MKPKQTIFDRGSIWTERFGSIRLVKNREHGPPRNRSVSALAITICRKVTRIQTMFGAWPFLESMEFLGYSEICLSLIVSLYTHRHYGSFVPKSVLDSHKHRVKLLNMGLPTKHHAVVLCVVGPRGCVCRTKTGKQAMSCIGADSYPL